MRRVTIDRRRLAVVAPAGLAFVASVYLANWLVKHVGPIRVWPTGLLAPAGVYVVGLAFLLRDTVQRFAGQALALGLIAAGTLASVLVSPKLALASGVAFAASEVVGLAVFWATGGNLNGRGWLLVSVACASMAAAALDSLLFLWIAFGGSGLHAYFAGQFVAKLTVVACAVPFVLLARNRWPTAAAPAAA